MGLHEAFRTYEKIVKANPDLAVVIKEDLAKLQRKTGPITVSRILEQQHTLRWASVNVNRRGNDVRIEWKFHPSVAKPREFSVIGHIREMSLVPDPSYSTDRLIVYEDGNGMVDLQLEEGQSYYFQFYFTNNAECKSERPASDFMDVIDFQVAVPLSDENKSAVRKVLESERDPAAKIRDEAEKILQQKDAFDQMVAEGIARIEAKNLPPKVKRGKIQDWKEDLERLKEKFGM